LKKNSSQERKSQMASQLQVSLPSSTSQLQLEASQSQLGPSQLQFETSQPLLVELNTSLSVTCTNVQQLGSILTSMTGQTQSSILGALFICHQQCDTSVHTSYNTIVL